MRLTSMVFGLFLALSMVFSSVGSASTTSEQDCLLDWLEGAYSSFLQPPGAQSAYWSTYYFRPYPGTDAYVGIESTGGHLWYLGPAAEGMFDLGHVSGWITRSGCAATSGSIDEVEEMVGKVLDLSSGTLDSGITDQLSPLLTALLTGNTSSVCPIVSNNINLNDPDLLTNFPDPALIGANYGTGCTTENGAFVSGQLNVTVNGFSLNQTNGSLNASLLLTLNDLTSNGQLIGDGQMSGNLNVLLSDDIAGTGSIQFTDFLFGDGTRLNGTLSVNAQNASDILININISDNAGLQAIMGIQILETQEGIYRISTPSAGTVNNYTVLLDNLIFNDAVCEEYPISGSVVFSQAGESWSATFDGSCTGDYFIQ